jgi:DNA-binding SARP family transcriptional activator/DNA-binding XRE family transcriptional regulator
VNPPSHLRSVRPAELVRQFRQRAGMTQQEAADRAGISAATLRDLEQGRVATPRPATLRRLAAALSLSGSEVDELRRAARPDSVEVRVHVLGPLVAIVNDQPADLGSATQRTLLGLLALAANTPVSRDVLIDTVWGPQPPPTVSDLLQTHISRLRRRLQPRNGAAARLLVATASGYQLTVGEDQLDLLTARRLVATARHARTNGDILAARGSYREAAMLWHGEPLADLPALQTHPAVIALQREWQELIVEYAEFATDLGRHHEVLPHLQRLTEADALHETAHAHLMIALAGTGRPAAALDAFDQLRRRLADELGTDPAPELIRVHEQVLRGDIARPAARRDAVGHVPADARQASARRQLPPDISDFTGREAELTMLRAQLSDAGTAGTAVAICAIQGMAGVGKTRLAVHLAHQLVADSRYADIQLCVDLHPHADQPPGDPAAVLASFLHVLGVPDAQIPEGVEARAALYRDQLHGKRALVLLDNASDHDQVRPLLPASPTSLAVITSRRTLALDGAITLFLDVFTRPEAEKLLARIAGERRVAADPAATRRVIDACSRLPLAIALAARRLQSRPLWTVADLATRLEETSDRLSELVAGNRHLRHSFDRSYHALPEELAWTFRRLGLHPGSDFSADSVAVLTGFPRERVLRLLDQLVDEHLLAMSGPDRYRLHGVVRDYARAQADQDGELAVRQAVTRVLHWYLDSADAARDMLFPHLAGALDDSDGTRHAPAFAGHDEALRWLVAEHANVATATIAALDHGLLSSSQNTRARRHQAETLQALGDVLCADGNHATALDCWRAALTLLGDVDRHLERTIRTRITRYSNGISIASIRSTSSNGTHTR